MNRQTRIRFYSLILILLALPLLADSTIPWNGYTQIRYESDYRDINSFAIRRAKLWLDGKTPFNPHWRYKIQTIFRYQNQGALSLQDAFVEYQGSSYRFRIGQQVPEFSQQRMQPDYAIPFVERASVINALIPAAESSARDIGVQFIANPASKHWKIAAGMFNGNGANQAGNEDQNFLFTTRGTLTTAFSKRIKWENGLSAAYRETNGLSFKKILGNAPAFSGSDFRWGISSRLTGPAWELQAEYLEAHLENQRAHGYYLLADYTISHTHLLGISLEQLTDLQPATNDDPWLALNYTRFVNGHQAKISLDSRMQIKDSPDYFTRLQIQIFFNQLKHS